jgi:hypothetical protein
LPFLTFLLISLSISTYCKGDMLLAGPDIVRGWDDVYQAIFMLKAGIVGLPNVGKSTLFNALVANAKAKLPLISPFVPLNRMWVWYPSPMNVWRFWLKSLIPRKLCRLRIEFVDIAGLVKGAESRGRIGNQFLANIRKWMRSFMWCAVLIMMILFMFPVPWNRLGY